MADGSVQVCLASSWPVVEGSLESCISVVFLDPHDDEPIVSSSPGASGKLVLVPPSDPAPCELTVKFRGRLCHVQSFYSLSTSRICELYSCASPEEDPEYICTVKGWQPQEANALDDEGGNKEATKDAARTTSSATNGMNFVGSMASNMGPSLNSPKLEDVDMEKSVYSGDDSWVDVKLNGLLAGDSTSESLTVPELDNWHMPLNEDELVHLEGKLVLGSLRPRPDDLGVGDDGCCELQGREQHALPQQNLYEAELELVDHSPWAAVTVRLLSLQDKSRVEIEQMVLLAVAGPVWKPAGAHHSMANEGNSALLAMFIPSMLQVARRTSASPERMMEQERLRVQRSEPLVQQRDAIPVTEVAPGNVSFQSTITEQVTMEEQHPGEVCLVPTCVGAETRSTQILEGVGLQDVNIESASMRLEKSDEQLCKSGSNVVPCCHDVHHLFNELKVNGLFHTLETFSERFDRLESLCVRMETYLKGAIERLDKRVTHLEEQQRKDLRGTNSSQEEVPKAEAALLQHTTDEPSTTSSIEQAPMSSTSPSWESKDPVLFALSGHAKEGVLDAKESSDPVLSISVNTHPSFALSGHGHAKEDMLEDLPSEALGPCPSISVNTHPSFALSGHGHAKEDMLEDLPSEALGPCPSIGVNAYHVTDNLPVNIIQGHLRESASMPVSSGDQAQKACPSVDDAWEFALSTFASSLVLSAAGTEEMLTGTVDGPVACSQRSQECETSKDGSCNSMKTYADPGGNDSSLENSDCGLNREDNEDEEMYTFLHGISKRNQGMVVPSHSEKACTSLPSAHVGSSGNEDIQVSLEENTVLRLNSTPPNNAATSTSGIANLPLLFSRVDGSPRSVQSDTILFDFGSAKQPATEIDHLFIGFCGDPMDEMEMSSSSQRASQTFSYELPDDMGINDAAWFTSDSSVFGQFAALQSKGCSGEGLRNMDDGDLEDLLSGPQPPEGAGSNTSKESTAFPDLIREGVLCSAHGEMDCDDTLCFPKELNNTCESQAVDSSDWFGAAAQSVFYMNDPELTDDEAATTTDKHETHGSSLLGGDDCSDTNSAQDLSFWSMVASNAGTKPGTTTAFPGFEDFS